MDAIGRDHVITRSFLQQVCLDIDRNGLSTSVKIPSLGKYQRRVGNCGSNIPLLARSKIAKHSRIPPVLPGRLPLGKPEGQPRYALNHLNTEVSSLPDYCNTLGTSTKPIALVTPLASDYASSNKRKRVSPGPSPMSSETTYTEGMLRSGFSDSMSGESTPQGSKKGGPTSSAFSAAFPRVVGTASIPSMEHVNLPHRGSPQSTSSPATGTTPTGSGSSSTTGTLALGATVEVADEETGAAAMAWASSLYSEVTDPLMGDVFGSAANDEDDPWTLLNGLGDNGWHAAGPR
jgi:hypothetical protein